MTVLTAVLLGAAAWLALPPSGDRRLLPAPRRGRGAVPGPEGGGINPALVRLAALVAGLAITWLVGGAIGAVLGATCAVALPLGVGRLEPAAERARRENLDRQAPLLADLLAATLASGATWQAALGAAVPAVGDPTAQALRPVVVALDLGADPVAAWRSVRLHEAHAEIATAVERAMLSGAPLAEVLARVGHDLRRRRRTRVEVAARSAGVQAVAPLAACFLPAFLLLGVAPVVVSLASALTAG